MMCSILYALDKAILEEHSKPVVCGHSNRQQNKRARHKHLIRKRIHGNQQLRKHQQPSKQRTHSTYAQCEACISGNFCWVVAYDNFLLSTWLRLSVLVRQPPSKSCQTNYEQFCSWLMLANQRWLARNRRQEATNRMKLKCDKDFNREIQKNSAMISRINWRTNRELSLSTDTLKSSRAWLSHFTFYYSTTFL